MDKNTINGKNWKCVPTISRSDLGREIFHPLPGPDLDPDLSSRSQTWKKLDLESSLNFDQVVQVWDPDPGKNIPDLSSRSQTWKKLDLESSPTFSRSSSFGIQNLEKIVPGISSRSQIWKKLDLESSLNFVQVVQVWDPDPGKNLGKKVPGSGRSVFHSARRYVVYMGTYERAQH